MYIISGGAGIHTVVEYNTKCPIFYYKINHQKVPLSLSDRLISAVLPTRLYQKQFIAWEPSNSPTHLSFEYEIHDDNIR